MSSRPPSRPCQRAGSLTLSTPPVPRFRTHQPLPLAGTSNLSLSVTLHSWARSVTYLVLGSESPLGLSPASSLLLHHPLRAPYQPLLRSNFTDLMFCFCTFTILNYKGKIILSVPGSASSVILPPAVRTDETQGVRVIGASCPGSNKRTAPVILQEGLPVNMQPPQVDIRTIMASWE